MSGEGEKKSLWDKVFGDPGESEDERRVLEYITHRLGEGAALESIIEEDYVRRNASRDQIDEICSNPKVVEAARGKMKDTFDSGELDPGDHPE